MENFRAKGLDVPWPGASHTRQLYPFPSSATCPSNRRWSAVSPGRNTSHGRFSPARQIQYRMTPYGVSQPFFNICMGPLLSRETPLSRYHRPAAMSIPGALFGDFSTENGPFSNKVLTSSLLYLGDEFGYTIEERK